MTFNKFALLAAAAAGAMGASAQAQQAFPAATLNGNGASLPANVFRQIADCYGQKQQIAFAGASGAVTTIFDFNYATTTTATIGNRFNCAGDNNATGNAPAPGTNLSVFPIASPNTAASIVSPFNQPRIIQPNIQINYFSTGSGAGINSWLRHLSPTVANTTPFFGSGQVAPTGWAGYGDAAIQFALSETALSLENVVADTTAPTAPTRGYTNVNLPAGVDNAGNAIAAATALTRYGAPIQLPMFVAPVAISYDPVYAKERNGGGGINEYRFLVAGARPDGSGGLKLTRAQYCGILNGIITNWNQLPTNVVNKDFNDPAPFNVPITLVGRTETSGTTSLFTRALAAQCTGLSVNTGVGGTLPLTPIVNAFSNSTDSIPAVIRAGNAIFNKGPSPTITGTITSGNYLTANGNDGVAQAVDFQVDPTTTIGNRTLNGKIGYNGTDFVLPYTLFTGANSYGLNTASLQNGTAFVAPTAKDATLAFSNVQPPQSRLTGGAYCEVACNTNTVNGGSAFGNRANPLDWVFPANKFLVDTQSGAVTALANPVAAPIKGYPIVGTSNVLLYTCYFTPATRIATNGLWATFLGATTKDFNNQGFPAALIWNATLGIQAKNGLASMPTGWRNAMRETFFKSSTQAAPITLTVLGSRNLWIQSRIPTVPNPATLPGSPTANNLVNSLANPTCSAPGRIGA